MMLNFDEIERVIIRPDRLDMRLSPGPEMPCGRNGGRSHYRLLSRIEVQLKKPLHL